MRRLLWLGVFVVMFGVAYGFYSSTQGSAPSRPPAPRVGDTCTNIPGGSFDYNDNGPGYVEQTALGLTCQGPAAVTANSPSAPTIPAGQNCDVNSPDYAGEAVCSWYSSSTP